jgi:hypothetical protein
VTPDGHLAQWEFAKRKHCEAIQNFVCADPPKPYKNRGTAAIEVGADEFYVEAEIYRSNDASLALARDMGLQFFEEHVTGAQTWNLRLATL